MRPVDVRRIAHPGVRDQLPGFFEREGAGADEQAFFPAYEITGGIYHELLSEKFDIVLNVRHAGQNAIKKGLDLCQGIEQAQAVNFLACLQFNSRQDGNGTAPGSLHDRFDVGNGIMVADGDQVDPARLGPIDN